MKLRGAEVLKVDELKNLRSTRHTGQWRETGAGLVCDRAVSLRGKVYKMKVVGLRTSQACRAAGDDDDDVSGISDCTY